MPTVGLLHNDFSWPYSFVNVCKLLDVCPDVIRAEIFADASLSWFDYWTKRAGRVSRRLHSSFVRVFASCRNPEGAEAGQLASCYLSGYEKTLHQTCSTAALHLAIARQGGQAQSRSVPGIQHGFV